MFDLNDEKQFGGQPSIFNGGEAGKVNNVSISKIEKKDSSDVTLNPDYKVYYKDESGSEINQSWYYFKPYPGADEASIEQSRNNEISKIRSLGVSIMGKDFIFPKVNSTNEALDVIMDLAIKNSANKKFNVYVTYGTKNKPSIYLGVRKYNFIESADTEISSLRPNPKDLLERPVPDEKKVTENWI